MKFTEQVTRKIRMDKPVFKKARIAPTPSGYLHLGNVLSFAITAVIAAKTGARILLRIDDFDRERTNKKYVQDIFDTLNFLEIPWDEGPRNMEEYEQEFSQIHRTDLYTKAVQQLRDGGHLFACTCTRTDMLKRSADMIYTGTCSDKHIPLDSENVSWRLHTTNAPDARIKTLDGNMLETAFPASMRDFIVRKKDGLAAYQLISVIDDLYFDVDLVVRGEDLWPSTLAQHYLATLLGHDSFRNIAFYHHPLIMDATGHKLSKSTGATSIQYFRNEHKKPADIYALIAHILGLSDTTDTWQGLVDMLGLKLGEA